MNDEIYQREKDAREQEEWGNLDGVPSFERTALLARIENLESAMVEIQCCCDPGPIWSYCEDALIGAESRPLSWSQSMSAERDALRAAVSSVMSFLLDDALAMTYQSLGQYRTAVIQALRAGEGKE